MVDRRHQRDVNEAAARFAETLAESYRIVYEQAADARMPRTARRPLPAGRLTAPQVLVFGTLTLVAGTLQLWLAVSVVTAAVALATWAIYVLVYTPLKTRTPLNTAVGAVSGALPVSAAT
jgi:heme o synthase